MPANTKVAGMFGEVLQVIGHVFPGAGGQIQVVNLIEHQIGARLGQHM
jgi:hypothetical protein